MLLASSDAASSAAKLCGDASRATTTRRTISSRLCSFIPHTPSLRRPECPAFLRQCDEMRLDPLIHTTGGKLPMLVALPGWHTGQQFDALIDRLHRIDMKTPGSRRFHNVVPEHQVLHVGDGDEYPLLSRQPLSSTDVEKAFDFLVDAADDLHLSILVDRTGHRHALLDGQIRQGREESIELGGGGAIPLHPAI